MKPGGILVATLACLALALAEPAAASPPSILVIVTDDQRWDTLADMPTVQDELVGKGVEFANAFAVSPLCCPSRASLFTGTYAHTHRVYHNRGPRGRLAFDERTSIALALRKAGYRTGLVGKYMNDYATTVTPPGWDRWVAFTGSITSGRPPNFFDYDLAVDGSFVSYGSDPEDYSTDVLAREADDFIRASADPFFLVFAPFAPHAPATPAPRHEDAFPDLDPWRPASYDEEDVSDKPAWVRKLPRLIPATADAIDLFRAQQLRSLLAVDEAVELLLDTLEEQGRLEDTLVVFTSDNGYFWGEHRMRAKRAPYEESIRVPLVVRYDALVEEPRREEQVVATIDLAPTFAQLAGIKGSFEGRTLRPLLRNVPVAWRTSFLVENLVQGGTAAVPSYCAVKARNWTYVALSTHEEELYDLRDDPFQLENRARDPLLRKQLLTMRARVLQLCRPAPPNMNLFWVCSKVGTPRRDVIRGTPGPDGVCGRQGNDVLRGGRGNDVVRGGPGRDRLYGGPGNDRIYARDGSRDLVFCGPGRDRAIVDRFDVVAADCELVIRPAPKRPR